jgi:transposase
MKITINYRFIVGIDISKLTLDLYLQDCKTSQGRYLQVANTPKGFARLGQWLASQEVARSEVVLCSEHTGRYGERLVRWSTQHRWPHAVVKTTALDKVSGEHHRKSDKWDAQGLAEYGARFSDRLRLREAPKHALKQLRRLRAERRKMVDQRGGLKAKRSEADYHDADMSKLVEMWNQQVGLLSEHIDQIEQRINELINQEP